MEKWLVIHPNTFLWYNLEKGLFYNSDFGTISHFYMTPVIYKYCVKINDYKNLYVIPVSQIDLEDKSFSSWVERIEEEKMGSLRILQKNVSVMSIPPILNLQPEIEERKMDSQYFRSTNIASNFHEVTFFLGGDLLSGKEQNYYRQITYPVSSLRCLSSDEIKSFLSNTNIVYLQQINIVCNSFANYPYWKELFLLLAEYHISVKIFVRRGYVDMVEKNKAFWTSKMVSLAIFFEDEEEFKKMELLLEKERIVHQWLFLIRNANEQDKIERILDEYPNLDCDLLPVVEQNETNMDFLKKLMFTTYDDFVQSRNEKRQIFCNQTINSNFWGHIFVSPNLEVFTNTNGKAWNLLDGNILNIIHEEVKDKKSFWRKTRDKVQPCSNCVFRYLCPPPSNYEVYLDKFDLCFMYER